MTDQPIEPTAADDLGEIIDEAHQLDDEHVGDLPEGDDE